MSTGIKEWRPPEKAAFIAKLINERAFLVPGCHAQDWEQDACC